MGAERRGSEAALGRGEEGDNRAAGDLEPGPLPRSTAALVFREGFLEAKASELDLEGSGLGEQKSTWYLELQGQRCPRAHLDGAGGGRGDRSPCFCSCPCGLGGGGSQIQASVGGPQCSPSNLACEHRMPACAPREGKRLRPSSPAWGHQRHPPWLGLVRPYGGGCLPAVGEPQGRAKGEHVGGLRPPEPPAISMVSASYAGSGAGAGPARADAQSQQSPGPREAAATQDPKKGMPPGADPAWLPALGLSLRPLPWWLCAPGPQGQLQARPTVQMWKRPGAPG